MLSLSDLEFGINEIADKRVLEKLDGVYGLLDKIGKALPVLHKAVSSPVQLPKVFQIRGSVQVENDVKVRNLKDLERYFTDLSTQIRMLAQAISSVPQQKIDFSKVNFPKPQEINFDPIVESLQELKQTLGTGSMDKDAVPVLRKIEQSISELVSRPVMTPQPVTNININPLQGVVKTTTNTVGTTLTQLPSYGQLFNRRAVLIYNNSNNAIYVGGSDITTSTGMPVPANSYSPILDAGYNMIVYGIASQGGNNVRVMEIASRSEGGVAIQE